MDTAIIKVVNKIRDLGGFAAAGFAVDEFLRLQGVDEQVRDLSSKLEFLRAWIQTAEEGNGGERDLLVNVWVNQLRAAVFEAEDVVDEYFQEVYRSRPGYEKTGRRRWPCTIPCIPLPEVPCFPFSLIPCFPLSEVPIRYDLSQRIGKVLGSLDKIKEDNSRNMQARVERMAMTILVRDIPAPPSLAQTTPWSAFLIGFDDYTKYIISHLLEDHGKRGTIVLVTGENSGVGKTTAARAVFRDSVVRRNFDAYAWVSMPPNSSADMYLDQIWEQAQKQTRCECPRRDVKKVLGKMKFFVVLDGMDDRDKLVEVLSALPGGAEGSRILVTTQLQSADVNQYVHDIITSVEIKGLTRVDCLKLFSSGLNLYARRVFTANCDTFSEKIYSISGGLPLAVVLLGGLLYFKDTKFQWDEIFNLLESYVHLRLIKRLLTVGYLTMPTDIKQCFVYFAAMPPNVHIDIDKLERLWSAEGIRGYYSRGSYIRVLVSRGLVEELEGGTKVRIHQSAHMFAKTIAHDTGSMEAHTRFDIIPGASTIRGLSVHNYDGRHMHMDNRFPKLRTLLGDFTEEQEAPQPSPSQVAASSSQGFNQQDNSSSRIEFIRHSKFIGVLDLQGVKLGKLPDSIGQMIHLRYLGLRCCSLKELPPSVADLLNLETLDITDNKVKTVVDGFWEIKKLKHVYAEELSLPVSENSTGSRTALDTLHGVILPSACTQENFPLRIIEELISLHCVGATSANLRVLGAALEKMRYLRHLKIAADCIPWIMKSTSLHSLELDGKILEDEVGSGSGTQSSNSIYGMTIILKSSCMSQMLLDSFLSNARLAELELLDNSFAGKKLLLQGDPFAHLRKLKIGNLEGLEEFALGESAMPDLVTLEMFGCPNMKIIQGLENSDQLEMVLLFDMPAVIAQLEAENKGPLDKIKHVRTAAWASTA